MTDIRIMPPLQSSAPVTQTFGENPQDYARFGQAGHNGIDYGVPEGTPIYAAADGTVDRAQFDPNGYGNYVRINHGGFSTLYGHMSHSLVGVGRKVEAGQLIGRSGNTGNSTGPHLHFELRDPAQIRQGWPQGAINPYPYFVAVGYSSPTPPTNSAEWEPPDTPQVNDGYAHVTGHGVNMRTAAGFGDNVAAVANPALCLTLTGEVEAGWKQVRVEGVYWVWGEYVE